MQEPPRRHALFVGAMVLLVACGLLVLRCGWCNAGERSLKDGLDLVLRGLEGDEAAFEEAEATLARAAGVTTSYPVFVLEAARRLRERRWDDAAPPVRVVFLALVERRWQDAAAAAAALPDSLPGREDVMRLVHDLEAARLAAHGGSER